MPLEGLSGLPKEAWLAFGAFSGAAATIVVGWFNLRKSGSTNLAAERAELSKGQRDLISLLRTEVNALHDNVVELEAALKAERESCDARMKEMDARYAREMQKLRNEITRGSDDGQAPESE